MKSKGTLRSNHKKLPALPARASRPAAKSSRKTARPAPRPAAHSRHAVKSKPHRSLNHKVSRPAKSIRPSGRATAAVVNHTAPVTLTKPRKNLAGFSSRELDHFRDLLLAKRRELIGDMSAMEREALRSSGTSNLSNLPIHMADMGTDNYEQEFTLGLVQKDRDLLKEINLALAKIQNGTYGLCEGTNLPILKERLEYQPWARYSVDYQRKMERHGR